MSSQLPGKRHVVLITAAGTGTAFGAAMALRRRWSNSVVLVAADTNPQHLVTTSLLADSYEGVPPSASPEFEDALRRILSSYDVDTYMPLVDHEILKAAKLREMGALPGGVRLMAPCSETAQVCLDKFEASVWMKKHGIRTPLTWLASTETEKLPDRFFMKRRSGFGSQGARIGDVKELEVIPVEERNGWVLQELCEGPEVTVDAFYDPERSTGRVACRERLETKSGVCTKARVFFDQTLAQMATNLARGLGLAGTYCFQVMRYRGHWAVTDINPRPGAGTAISVAAGMDFFAAYFDYAWGNDGMYWLEPLSREVIVTRQYSEFVMT